jgi:hypothetical protein
MAPQNHKNKFLSKSNLIVTDRVMSKDVTVTYDVINVNQIPKPSAYYFILVLESETRNNNKKVIFLVREINIVDL